MADDRSGELLELDDVVRRLRPFQCRYVGVRPISVPHVVGTEVRIRCSRPGVYLELLENVQVHGYHLMLDQEHLMTPCEIAAEWYDHVFLPAVEARRAALGERANDDEDGDAFLRLHRIRRATHVDRGCEPLEEIAKREAAGDDRNPSRLRSLAQRVLGGR